MNRIEEPPRRLEEVAATDHATGVFGTSRGAAALFPIDSAATLGVPGVPIGPTITRWGGSTLFSFDQWRIYERRERFNVTSPNVFVMGELGSGKSTFMQAFLRRQHTPFGRFIRVISPRRSSANPDVSEYWALCEDLNGQHLRLVKGGNVRLNFLEDPETRYPLLRGVAAAAARRPLLEGEPMLLNLALAASGKEPVLPLVLDRLFHPSPRMASRAGLTVPRFAEKAWNVAAAMQPLCEGEMAGLVDGPTSDNIRADNRFTELDLSSWWETETLAILMACAVGYMQALINRHWRHAASVGALPHSIFVIDEAWKTMALHGMGPYLQERWKYARTEQSNIGIIHGPRDLSSGGDEGSRTAKLAEGLIRDTDMFFLFKNGEDDARAIQDLLGLSNAERQVITSGLRRAGTLVRIGNHRAVVHVQATKDSPHADLNVTSPDQAMTG